MCPVWEENRTHEGIKKPHHFSIVAAGHDPCSQNRVPEERWLNTLWLTWRKLYPTSDSGTASSWDQVALSGRWERGSPRCSDPAVPVLLQQQDTKDRSPRNTAKLSQAVGCWLVSSMQLSITMHRLPRPLPPPSRLSLAEQRALNSAGSDTWDSHPLNNQRCQHTARHSTIHVLRTERLEPGGGQENGNRTTGQDQSKSQGHVQGGKVTSGDNI